MVTEYGWVALAQLFKWASKVRLEDNAVVRDPMAARNALSRFQAAQRAAREQVQGERPEGPAR